MLDKKSNTICVVKKIRFETVTDVYHISTEIQVLRKVSHPNVVKYFGMFIDDNFMCISMEFCSEGDISQWIDSHYQNNDKMPEDLFFSWVRQISSAMAHLHKQDILHRDLKPSNVLLTRNELNQIIPKVADFGLSYELVRNKSKASSNVGTQLYVSHLLDHLTFQWPPEMYAGENPGKSADVYSCGCIFYEMTMGPKLHASSLLLSEKKEGLLRELSMRYSEGIGKFIRSMLRLEPQERPSFETLLHVLEHQRWDTLQLK